MELTLRYCIMFLGNRIWERWNNGAAIGYYSAAYEIRFLDYGRCEYDCLDLLPFVSRILRPREWRVGKVALVQRYNMNDSSLCKWRRLYRTDVRFFPSGK